MKTRRSKKLYDQLEEILGKQKGTDNVIFMGDFNAVVGEGKEDRAVGKFELGKRNDRGERLIEFCKSQKSCDNKHLVRTGKQKKVHMEESRRFNKISN